MTSHTTTATAPTTEVTNDSPWGLSAVQEDSEDDNLNNNINNNGDTLESMSDEALACAELMEIMGNSSRGSSRPVSLSGSPDRFSSNTINSSNISNINKKFIMKSTTKSMEELKISDNKNNIINDFYDDNDRNENIVTANVSNSYDELKAIEIEKMRQRPFTISTSTLNASSSSASGSTTTSPTTIRPSRLAQRSKQFPHNHNQQQLLRPTSLYQTNHYYYDNNNKNDSGIEGETNFYDGDLNNENAASDITKIGGISRMINNLNDNSFENVSKIPHNLSKASKTAIFMSISEGGRRRSLSVGSAGLKTGSKIIGC
nr:10453_t:CDS:2 [Entrophospora candida]